MNVNRLELVTKLIDSYEGYFDITRFTPADADYKTQAECADASAAFDASHLNDASNLNDASAAHDASHLNGASPAVPPALVATGDFHSRLEKYVLVKKAQLWATETNEYVYFYSAAELTFDLWARLYDFTVTDALKKIRPHKNHMCSYITAIVIADSAQKDAKKALKRSRFFKNFKFSFHGYSMLRACVFEVNGEKLTYNAQGRDVGKNILNLYKEQKK